MNLSSLWAELSPHLFHLLLGTSLLCLMVGIFVSMRQTGRYRKQMNLFSDTLALTATVPTVRIAAPAAASNGIPKAAFSPASMLSENRGAPFRIRPAIVTPAGDSMLLRMLFACLPPSHFMLTDRPLGEIVVATGALPPELRSGAGTALENVRVSCIVAEMATLRPCGVVIFDNGSLDAFIDRVLVTAGLPVQHIEPGSPLRIEEVAALLRDGLGIPGASVPALPAVA